MTETLADNGGTKVVDQLLIDISTGDFSVLDSQTSARDNTHPIESGKSVSRTEEVNEWNYRENHGKSISQLDGERSVDGCFERPEWTKRPSATIFVVYEPNDINYDLGFGNVHSGENLSQEKKRWNSPVQKREGTGVSFLYWLDWKSKH